jgi:hypothetical protein
VVDQPAGWTVTIYFIEMEGSKAIKIGFTAADDVSKRLAQLQTGQPNKLSVLGSIAGNQDAERSLHAIFAAYRMNGEWFEGPPLFRQFLRFVVENGFPWNYCRAYGALDAMVAEQSARVEQLEAEKSQLEAEKAMRIEYLEGKKLQFEAKKIPGAPDWRDRQIDRLHRRYKEQKETIEALLQENALLLNRVDSSKPEDFNSGLLDQLETRQPVLETPVAMAG